jgi:hypothetical protein
VKGKTMTDTPDTSPEAIAALLDGILEGPWMVKMRRDDEGVTGYCVMQHDRTAICVDRRGYWVDGHIPPADEDGYNQPDEHMDCAKWRIETARFIAAARDLVPALAAERDALRERAERAEAQLATARADALRELGFATPAPRSEAVARAAMEWAANLCNSRGIQEQAAYGLNRAAQNYYRARDYIRALASDPATIAAIIDKAREGGE